MEIKDHYLEVTTEVIANVLHITDLEDVDGNPNLFDCGLRLTEAQFNDVVNRLEIAGGFKIPKVDAAKFVNVQNIVDYLKKYSYICGNPHGRRKCFKRND